MDRLTVRAKRINRNAVAILGRDILLTVKVVAVLGTLE